MNICDRIKSERQKIGYTQQKLGKYLNVTQQAIGKWEKGVAEPDSEALNKMSELFSVSIDYLLGNVNFVRDNFNIFDIPNIIPMPETVLIPLVGTIACGTPTLADENIEEYIKKDTSIKASFALRCKGDSMINARIFDGDIVYIRQQDDVENGEIAAVLIDNEATLKRVYKYPNRIELRAENPTFATIQYEGEQFNNIRIMGKAVAFLSTIR